MSDHEQNTKDTDEYVYSTLLDPSKEIDFLIDDFKDTSSKLESTDHKVQFFVQIYIAFLTAVVSALALFMFNAERADIGQVDYSQEIIASVPIRIGYPEFQRVIASIPRADSLSVILLQYYKTDYNRKYFILSKVPDLDRAIIITSTLRRHNIVFNNDLKILAMVLIAVFLTMLTHFLLQFVIKAEASHNLYIGKMNLIRRIIFESKDCLLAYRKELFIHEKGKSHPKAGLSNEIKWLLQSIRFMLILVLLVIVSVMVMSCLGSIYLELSMFYKVAIIFTVSLSILSIVSQSYKLSIKK